MMADGMVLEFQKRERHQSFNFPLVSLGEFPANKQCRRDSFLQKEVYNFQVEIGGNSCFAGIKSKGDGLLSGRQVGNDLPTGLRTAYGIEKERKEGKNYLVNFFTFLVFPL